MFKKVLDHAREIKYALGPLLGEDLGQGTLDAAVDLLRSGNDSDFQAALRFLLGPHLLGSGIFDLPLRDLVSYRLAYNYKNLKEGAYISAWSSFKPNDEIFFQILNAKPCRINSKIYACLELRSESSTSAGYIFELTLSLPQCSRIAYCIGFSRRRVYDGDPRNLIFLRFKAKVKGGTELVLQGAPETNTNQDKHNRSIIKKRCGECPMDFTWSCLSCKRTHGDFTFKGTTCDGSIKS